MNDLENPNGPDGALRGTEPHQDARSLGDHCRQIHHDAHTLAAAVQEAIDEVERSLSEQVEKRPYATLGVAAGVGYVLGGGLRSRLTVVLLGAATRLATALAVRELGARILQRDTTSVQSKSA